MTSLKELSWGDVTMKPASPFAKSAVLASSLILAGCFVAYVGGTLPFIPRPGAGLVPAGDPHPRKVMIDGSKAMDMPSIVPDPLTTPPAIPPAIDALPFGG